MIPAPFKVVLDANVLFPYSLRDTLLRAAAAGFFQIYWSDLILEEARRNLVDRNITTAAQADRLVATMKRAFPEALITGHETLIPSMKNQEDDRHVAAAAVKAGAQVIVTSNLRDFRELPDGIEAQSADHFLGDLFDLNPDGMVELVMEQAAGMKKPPRSFDELVCSLTKLVPEFTELVRERAASWKPSAG